ncbi:AEC family transporter [Sulfurospirillum barnesii]|uniref:Putative permease n=1 Tax=Sulfurospirillum barnesii (strain ATCC 700032 / DSM 10660 / SES-3) TaxID=760154 RepID=I3XYM9_SULBS|nr:AEC family transporter [Sulfurospirillum barnesii]AFL69053.1 putative permease [Sulfurospirillum barnesii SES-3]
MTYVLNSLLPICLIVAIGYTFRHMKFPSTDFWPLADRFTYYVLMPALLVYKLSVAKLELAYTAPLVLTTLLSIVAVLVLLLFLNTLLHFEAKAFTSIVQGGIRFNSYVLLAFVDTAYGDEGLVLSAIVMAFAIPFINVLCIGVFAFYTRNGRFSLLAFLKTIIKNPLIGACALGVMINLSGWELPLFTLKTLSLLSNAALPIGLLSVGVGLELRYLKVAKKELVVSSVAKLLLFPLLAYGIGLLCGLSGIHLSIAILFGSMPTAISSYILARELGGDVSLMASIITLQTLACMGTLLFIAPFL